MNSRFIGCILALVYAICLFAGQTYAGFSDYSSSAFSLTSGSVEMGFVQSEEDPSTLVISVTNEGTLDSDLWLKNLTLLTETEDAPPFDASAAIEVLYNDMSFLYSIDSLSMQSSPMLLLSGINPGGVAQIRIWQSNPSIYTEKSVDDTPLEDQNTIGFYEQISMSSPCFFEFVLECSTFSSLSGEAVINMTQIVGVYHEPEPSDEPVDLSLDDSSDSEPEEIADEIPEVTPADDESLSSDDENEILDPAPSKNDLADE